ncbi:hypothetical protein TNCV_1991111 [Trichonephila clavipes]|nr:hypothetical protein TNCV_1991111 [Trichonephila clavipes]
MAATLATDSDRNHTSQKSINLIILILGQRVICRINFVVRSLVFLGVAFTVASSVYVGIQISNKSEKQFLKINANSERSLKFQKELRSRISGYHDIHKQLINRLSPQKLITYLWCKK